MHDVRVLALGATLLATLACGSDSPTGLEPLAEAPRQRIAAGDLHTCRIAGTATHCWGAGYFGRLGNGSNTDASVPVVVQGGHTFVTLSAGGNFNCALTAAGEAYCWGYNGEGQLGSGHTEMSINTPVAVVGGHAFVTISSAETHTCALTQTGEAFCWGDNQLGQLGDGSKNAARTPVPVSTALRFSRIAAFGEHTCALTPTGAAHCWGNNYSGQLGDATTIDRLTPVAVAGGHAFADLAGGYDFTCAITAAGKPYCWGSIGKDGLGISTADATLQPEPVPMPGTVTLKGLAHSGVAMAHLCGYAGAGAAYCAGYNASGQLGDGTDIDKSSMIQIAPTLTWQEMAAGRDHTCGLTTDGATYCWGYNGYGQVGNGTTTVQLTPTPVASTASALRVAGTM